MLTTVRIKNLALAEDLTIGFESGLTAITGETGAGKSILIGAVKLALGERADRTLIRSGSEQCTIEVVFSLPPKNAALREFLEDQGIEIDPENQLFVKRTFSASGTNRQSINGSPVPLQTLVRMGELLVDLHGPHDHQSLLHPPQQREILDAFGNLGELREEYASLARQIAALDQRKSELIGDDQTIAQQTDMLRFQVKEIESARLSLDEEAQLEADYSRSSNAARVLEITSQGLDLLSENENSVLSQLAQVTRLLQELVRIDPEAATFVGHAEQVTNSLRDLQTEWRQYADKVDVDPARLVDLEERLNLIKSLKRKYGRSISEILQHATEASAKLEQLELRAETLAELDRERSRLIAEIWKKGRELSAQRRAVIPRLVKATVAELRDLGFNQCTFEVRLSSEEIESTPIWTRLSGLDQVEFEFSPNVGEPARPLRTIASSGEMARVMLALKTALADEDSIPVLVFDEIDANVGGETASKVGDKMLKIARRHQVLCITHLPAVAAAAHQHLVVSKIVRDSRTFTEVAAIGAERRVDEIARMLGGKTKAAVEHAQTLLERS